MAFIKKLSKKITVLVLIALVLGLGLFKIRQIDIREDRGPDVEVESSFAAAKIEGTNFFATSDGLVVEDSQNKNLPILFLPYGMAVNLGERVSDKNIIFAVNLADGLSKTDFSAKNIRIIPNDNIAFYNQEDMVAIFSSAKDKDSQIDSLQQVLAKAKMDASKIAKIDLRFDKPIITYK